MAAINQVLSSDKLIRLNDYSVLPMVSSFNWSPNFSAQDIFELGKSTKLDTALEVTTSGSFEVTSVGSTAGLLARMKVTRDGSGNVTGFEYASGDTNKNNYDFDQDDLAEMKFDILVHEKPDQKNFTRTLVLPCSYLTSFSGRADANGMASETYNFGGTFVAGFASPYHDVRALWATRTGNTTAQVIDGASMTGYTLAFVIIDGRVINTKATSATNPTNATMSTAGVVTISTTEGYTIPAGAMITAYVYKTAGSATFPSLSEGSATRLSVGTKPVFYVKGHQINIWLANDPANVTKVTTANVATTFTQPTGGIQWLRVQSIDWSVDLRIDQQRQIAFNNQGTSIYSTTPMYPIDISVNVTVNEADWSDWKTLLSGKTFSGSNVNDFIYDFAPNSIASEFVVVVEYFAKTGEKLQQWQFRDLRIDGHGSRISVGGKSEISWSFKGTEIALAGRNP